MKIVTHNSKFHVDEVFAVATIELAYEGEKIEIIRTRDPKLIKTGNVIVDVGGEYNSAKNIFDHHQQGGADARENGIPYSSFGLVWKKYGEKICDSKIVSEMIDRSLVMPIDAVDNGVSIQKSILEDIYEYTVGDLINAFNPSWDEEANRDEIFVEVVAIAKKVLSREIIKMKGKEKARALVKEAYTNAPDKRIIILKNYLPWGDVLSNYADPLFVVYPNSEKVWHVQTVRDDPHLFVNRKDLPKSWGGKNNEELAEITGVEDAIFCHKALFLCGARSKEGATKLADIALNT